MRIIPAEKRHLTEIVNIACCARQIIYADFIEPKVWEKKRNSYFLQYYQEVMKGRSKIEKVYFPVLENVEGNVLGFGIAGYINEEDRHHLPLHWVYEIFLDPTKIGAGNGKLLMRAMALHLENLGSGEFGLVVGKNNEKALRFYERLGGRFLRASENNRVHGYIVPANVMFWDSKRTLLNMTQEAFEMKIVL
jgi:L-amino acid N-acyltransferase YncA